MENAKGECGQLTAAGGSGVSRRACIFVVENDEKFQRCLVRAIAIFGFDPRPLRGLGDFDVALRNKRPDGVLIDWHLGDGNASRVIEQLKQLGIPVLIMTGDPSGAAAAAGVPLIEKPFELEKLRLHLESLCHSR